ncbi:Uncharacterised protein [Vibrio cholerae]|nr:Uncharacterised protein [Vibrio cholerae]
MITNRSGRSKRLGPKYFPTFKEYLGSKQSSDALWPRISTPPMRYSFNSADDCKITTSLNGECLKVLSTSSFQFSNKLKGATINAGFFVSPLICCR